MASRPPETGPEADAARNRWIVIQVSRLMGFAMVILGILMTQGAIDLAGDVNELTGYLLIGVGLADGFLVPQILARKWRTPRP